MSIIKKFFPGLISIVTIIILLYYRDIIIDSVTSGKIILNGLYAAVFDWSAIQTGFLFGVFGYITGKTDGFMVAIKNTKAMGNFKWNLKKAMLAGFVLTFTSMPMIVYPLKPNVFAVHYVIFCVWIGLFVWAFILFCLVAYNFGVILKVPDNEDRLAH